MSFKELLNGADPALAAKVVLEFIEDGIVSTDTLINAQNAGICVDFLLDNAEEIYELTQDNGNNEQLEDEW